MTGLTSRREAERDVGGTGGGRGAGRGRESETVLDDDVGDGDDGEEADEERGASRRNQK